MFEIIFNILIIITLDRRAQSCMGFFIIMCVCNYFYKILKNHSGVIIFFGLDVLR